MTLPLPNNSSTTDPRQQGETPLMPGPPPSHGAASGGGALTDASIYDDAEEEPCPAIHVSRVVTHDSPSLVSSSVCNNPPSNKLLPPPEGDSAKATPHVRCKESRISPVDSSDYKSPTSLQVSKGNAIKGVPNEGGVVSGGAVNDNSGRPGFDCTKDAVVPQIVTDESQVADNKMPPVAAQANFLAVKSKDSKREEVKQLGSMDALADAALHVLTKSTNESTTSSTSLGDNTLNGFPINQSEPKSLFQPLSATVSSTELVQDDVREWDILSGRGGKSNHHPGNKRFRQVVEEMKSKYRTTNVKTDKTALSKAIVAYVHGYGGRFLKRTPNSKWLVMTQSECRKKTSQALRETKELKWTLGDKTGEEE